MTDHKCKHEVDLALMSGPVVNNSIQVSGVPPVSSTLGVGTSSSLVVGSSMSFE